MQERIESAGTYRSTTFLQECECFFWGAHALSGSIRIENLPDPIETIDLHMNQLSGEFHMHSFPASLRLVDTSQNAISYRAVLGNARGRIHFYLKNDKISCVVDENGDAHVWSKEISGSFGNGMW